MIATVTRRNALRGSLAVSLGLAAGLAPALAEPAPDSVLIAAAEALRASRAREQRAWAELPDDHLQDDPAYLAVLQISDGVCAEGETLAEISATTPAGLAAKASAMLALVGWGRWAGQEAFAEHHHLVASVLRDAVRLGGGANG